MKVRQPSAQATPLPDRACRATLAGVIVLLCLTACSKHGTEGGPPDTASPTSAPPAALARSSSQANVWAAKRSQEDFIRSPLTLPNPQAAQQVPIRIGAAFDSVSGNVAQPCVVNADDPRAALPPLPTSEANPAGGVISNLDLNSSFKSTTTNQVAALTVAAKFGYGAYSGSGDYSSYNAHRSSEFGSVIHVIADAYTRRDLLDTTKIRLHPDIKGAIPRVRCGDYLVVGAAYGARLHARFDQFFADKNERALTAAALQATVDAIGGNAEAQTKASKEFDEAKRENRLHMVIVRQDGPCDKFFTPGELVNAAYNWRAIQDDPSKCSKPSASATAARASAAPASSPPIARGSGDVVIGWMLLPYTSVFTSLPQSPLGSQQTFFSRQYERLAKLQGIQDALDAVAGSANKAGPGLLGRLPAAPSPDEAPSRPQKKTLKDYQDEVTEAMRRIETAVERCGDGSDASLCVAPAVEQIERIEPHLPYKRKVSVAMRKDTDAALPADDPYHSSLRVFQVVGSASAHCSDVPRDEFQPSVLKIKWKTISGETKLSDASQQLVLAPHEEFLGIDMKGIPAPVSLGDRGFASACDEPGGLYLTSFVPLFPSEYSTSLERDPALKKAAVDLQTITLGWPGK